LGRSALQVSGAWNGEKLVGIELCNGYGELVDPAVPRGARDTQGVLFVNSSGGGIDAAEVLRLGYENMHSH
jgi:hypothetical protein